MAKRRAEDSLESIGSPDSPASKKVRVEDLPDRSKPTDAISPPKNITATNGRRLYEEEQIETHILATEIHERRFEEDELQLLSNDVQDEQSAYSATSRQSVPLDGFTDLYLDTIDRSVLDFDFEKLCSITLSNINVYACLVCGKYYQGRGVQSHAYFHALEVGHHVFVNMQSKRVYVLPEGYEVTSKSLEDIKFVVDPQLSKDEVSQLDREPKEAFDLSGKKYRPGMSPQNPRMVDC